MCINSCNPFRMIASRRTHIIHAHFVVYRRKSAPIQTQKHSHTSLIDPVSQAGCVPMAVTCPRRLPNSGRSRHSSIPICIDLGCGYITCTMKVWVAGTTSTTSTRAARKCQIDNGIFNPLRHHLPRKKTTNPVNCISSIPRFTLSEPKRIWYNNSRYAYISVANEPDVLNRLCRIWWHLSQSYINGEWSGAGEKRNGCDDEQISASILRHDFLLGLENVLVHSVTVSADCTTSAGTVKRNFSDFRFIEDLRTMILLDFPNVGYPACSTCGTTKNCFNPIKQA